MNSKLLRNRPITPAADIETAEETVTLPKGQIVKISGLPFELAADAQVFGSRSNLELALREQKLSQNDGPAEYTGG